MSLEAHLHGAEDVIHHIVGLLEDLDEDASERE